MTWILQNEKPIQEHFTRPCWVQRKDGLIWYAAPGANQMGNCFTFNGLVTNDGCNEFVVVSTPLREIVAWQYAEMPAQPEPYVAQKPPKDLVGKWIDGAEEKPTLTWHYLIQPKVEPRNQYARYSNLREVFIDAFIDVVWLPEEVWWLKLEDKKEDDGDE